MEKFAELIITDSYFKVFDVLTDRLISKSRDIDNKNVVFCEEKISLMTERAICDKLGGSFNTDVFSFSNYLKSKKPINALSREGSAMVIRRILAGIELNALNKSRASISPALFDLIAQLKSASVSHKDLSDALPLLSTEKRGRLADVAKIYAAYDEFISERGFTDQSTFMDDLPAVIEGDKSLNNAEIFLLGYNSWTAQARRAITSLIKTAGKVNAILTGGKNEYLFLNETAGEFKKICKSVGVSVKESFVSSYQNSSAGRIAETLFAPAFKGGNAPCNDVFVMSAKTPESEIKNAAVYIADQVKHGARYRDFTVALPDETVYGEDVKRVFDLYGIPYFLDEKIKPECHPLVRLIYSFIDAKRKNYDRKAVISFMKNPLFCDDKELTDFIEDKLYYYNVNYRRIYEPFPIARGEEIELRAEEVRKTLCDALSCSGVRALLKKLNVHEKLELNTKRLSDIGQTLKARVNEQIEQSVLKILDDMDSILDGVVITPDETKSVFKSGVNALELSVIPQYADAVFVGGYRSTALAKAKCLFAVGLTSDVPSVKSDAALLTDADIDALKSKIVIDPTIRIVNLREKENFGVALAAFSDRLVLSYPETSFSGAKNLCGDALRFIKKAFTVKPFAISGRYLTEKEGLLSFAEDCAAFSKGEIDDFTTATSYYEATKNGTADKLLKYSNREIKERISDIGRDLFTETSPTKIEDYYKCPYQAFARRVLRLKEKDEGGISNISVGIFLHDVFRFYFSRISEVHDRTSSDKLYDECKTLVMSSPDYKKFSSDAEMKNVFDRVVSEGREYCFKSFLYLRDSKFKPYKLEKRVEYVLPKTGVKLVGTVDRVDKFGDFLRIIDYKTGNADFNNSMLYSGNKLQLFLYAASFIGGARISGLYYAPVSSAYKSADKKVKKNSITVGKTLDDVNAVSAQNYDGDFVFADASLKDGGTDKTVSEAEIKACIEYAEMLCEKAIEEMRSGVMMPSPYEGQCDNCPLKGMCDSDGRERSVGAVSGEEIIAAVDTEKKDGT